MVNEELLVQKLDVLRDYLQRLRTSQDVSWTEYTTDIVIQDAIKEQFKVTITCCNDIAAHIRKARGLPQNAP